MRNRTFFLGEHKRRRYFEGWYFKCISKDRKHAVAFIPGMAISPEGNRHAFIQVIHAETGKTYYYRFPYDHFIASSSRFDVDIAGNRFGPLGLSVNLSESTIGSAYGSLTFTECRDYPTTPLHPSIMGPFAFLPNMECNHVIIHLAHRISGSITLDGAVLDFTDGAGYIEKDFGRSFPSTYVWLQASHFNKGDASFVFSRANIPFLGTTFPGFFAYFTDFSGQSARFATYNRSTLTDWAVNKDKGFCSGKLVGPAGTFTFSAEMSSGGVLRAPVDGLMDREIIESIQANVHITWADNTGIILYQGSSGEAGMEISH